MGMRIDPDLLNIFGNRVILYQCDPKQSGASGFVLEIKDRQEAVARSEQFLRGIAALTRQSAGEQTDEFVRIRQIDRGEYTTIYPQSVLPGAITPIITVGDKWMAINFSASAAARNSRAIWG
mgnify:FL=1